MRDRGPARSVRGNLQQLLAHHRRRLRHAGARLPGEEAVPLHEDVPQFLRSGLVQWWKSTADGHQRKPWLSSFESSNEPLPEGSPCDYIREWYKVFRFEECWLKLEGLEDLVASAWDKNLRRNEAIRTFHAKPRTAVALKKWNKEISA